MSVCREPVRGWVGLGANLGDAAATLGWAVQALHAWPGTRVVGCSSLYRTAPVDADGPDYFNAVVAVDTTLPAPRLLSVLLQLEQAAGRQRPYWHAPRTLDLDLLLYGQGWIQSPTLTVPHPRMWGRAFVLLPLAELAPQKVPQEALQAVGAQSVERVGVLNFSLS